MQYNSSNTARPKTSRTTISIDLIKDNVNHTGKSIPLQLYTNSTYGVKIQHLPNWKPVECAGADYRHNQSSDIVHVIVEFLAPKQSIFYIPNLTAAHNSIRSIVEDYNKFDDSQQQIDILDKIIPIHEKDKLTKITNKRLGAIGILALTLT